MHRNPSFKTEKEKHRGQRLTQGSITVQDSVIFSEVLGTNTDEMNVTSTEPQRRLYRCFHTLTGFPPAE